MASWAGKVRRVTMRRAALFRLAVPMVLLVVPIACLALMKCREQSSLRRLQKNGRSIYQIISYRPFRYHHWDLDSYPKTEGKGSFRTSTAFFRAYQEFLVRNGRQDQYFFWIFGAPELSSPVSKTQTPSQFLATNNAWCVVGDLDESEPSDVPFIFTKNLRGGSLSEVGTLFVRDGRLLEGSGVIVVTRVGNVSVLLGTRCISDYFGKWKGMTNVVLRP